MLEHKSENSVSECCVGRAQSFRVVLDLCRTIANRECTVVLRGESGCGKEVIAKQIHYSSDRCAKPFIPVDCTNLSGELFASQLFGHVKGAFTGADRDTLGFIRAADGGTLFLDEIGELNPQTQSKLLRVLQDSIVTPVGSTKQYPVSIRLVCATHRDIEAMVRKGTFRQDLYFRINVISLRIPPLRERIEDILPLAEHFLLRQAHLYSEPVKRLTPETRNLLEKYTWPGNVRELSNIMERSFVLSPDNIIPPGVLPPEIVNHTQDHDVARVVPSLDQANRKLIVKALEHSNWRKRRAANLLQIDHRKLNRMIERLHIEH
ncbi:MAG: sigma-54-dependent Fis family transcriptional regulator [Anaerohalosphaera sp.]|nr:sigma-54-dependent Fis family transcriptional regulator [Anaerohalosphaera sp.]